MVSALATGPSSRGVPVSSFALFILPKMQSRTGDEKGHAGEMGRGIFLAAPRPRRGDPTPGATGFRRPVIVRTAGPKAPIARSPPPRGEIPPPPGIP